MASLVLKGLGLPLLGTVFGSSFVYFLRKQPERRLMMILDSFAAGIMSAASFFSLISPAVKQAEANGNIYLLTCCIGFFLGTVTFVPVDRLIKRRFADADVNSGKLLLWAVSLHNIPEGMAVGVVYAGLLAGKGDVGTTAALALSFGIALQNIPEGAIISLPLNAKGKSRGNAFVMGLMSGMAELVAGIAALFLASFVSDILPFSLCFAAGAMFYVVLKELSGGFRDEKYSGTSLTVFATGFFIMMALDTLLG